MKERSKRRDSGIANKKRAHPYAVHGVISAFFFVATAVFLLFFHSGKTDHLAEQIGLLLPHGATWVILHLALWSERTLFLKRRRFAALLLLLFVFTAVAKPLGGIHSTLIPIPAFVMLVGILFSARTALILSLGLLYYVGLVTPIPYSAYLIVILFGSMTVPRIQLRSHILIAGLLSGGVLATYQLAATLQFGWAIGIELLYPLLNGLLSAILAVGLMPLFESTFSILTPLRLLELSDPNKPLLKRLLMEAPGTYHHSIMVGNLAETAAHNIGADEILTRVAAYYHDVGKLERPLYFKENQFHIPNPHDTMPPRISAEYIKSHMTYGIGLLQAARIPREIIEVVASHHGTSLIKYFYHKEKSQNPQVDIADFVYPGPKPRSKEAVILMLADSIEAAVRSERMATTDELKQLIEKIVEQKISEKQLSDATLTFAELEKVKKSFCDVISGTFHQRIAYPEVDLGDVEPSAFDEKERREHDHRNTK